MIPHVDVVLRIIELCLQITLEIIKGIPIESRQEIWRDHERNLAFWRGLVEKMTKDEKK